MDIFMTNIGFGVNRDRLKIQLAEVLHGPPYSTLTSTQSPMNLNVIIHRKKGPNPQRSGILTVPTMEIGQLFLREFGGHTAPRTIALGTKIKFQPSNKPARQNIIEEVRRVPYDDPRLSEERQRSAAEWQSKTITLRVLQFGWECRDSTFSVEWERICGTRCELVFHEDRREFRIQLSQGVENRLVVFRASQISWASAGVDTSETPHLPVIFLSLAYPPAYETEAAPAIARNPSSDFSTLFSRLGLTPHGSTGSPSLLLGESHTSDLGINFSTLFADVISKDLKPLRQRWPCLEDGQTPYTPFVSTALRLVCSDTASIKLFQQLCRHANTQVDDYLYPIVRRDLFALDIQENYAEWVRSLPWLVAFQVESLTRGLVVDMTEALGLAPKVSSMLQSKGKLYTSQFLRQFATQAKSLFGYSNDTRSSTTVVGDLFSRYEVEYAPIKQTRSRRPPNPDTFECLHVTVTPTTFHLEGPYPERSNRIMRSYSHNQDSFLRVNFEDETGLQYRFDREVDGRAFIHRRIGTILSNGIDIADRHFEFLAYSQSALKEHAVWFVKEFRLADGSVVNARTIIAELGDFTREPQLVYCPARYAARISQAFTATDSSVSVEADEIFKEDDIMDATGNWCFTDGVGTISTQLARDIWKVLASRRRGAKWQTYPRALQVRFQGSKGMLSVDHTVQGRAICLRPSMIKFEAPNSTHIEIARAFNRPGPFYLNRPLIMVLEDLGVPYDVFADLQDAAVQDAQSSVESLEKSARLLETFGLGGSFRLTSIMLSLHKLGLGPLRDDEFWQQMMDFAVNHVLRELKHHARIPVPEGWNIVGVADVHGYLQEGQIFGCIVPTDGSGPIYLQGPTLVTRSPTIHPGDVQVAFGIGRPPPGSPFEKQDLRNTLVFSTKGSRPLPSYLGGGDLDGRNYYMVQRHVVYFEAIGDEYRVTMLESLRPRRLSPPANYTPAPKKLLDRPSTMQDVAEFVAEYIYSDSLGIIAITWLIIADQSPLGIFDPDCLKLSDLHSDAVDYPKNGRPVPLNELPRLKMPAKPDWNAPETVTTGSDNNRYYISERAIGRLCREIDLPAVATIKREQRRQRSHLSEGQQYTINDVLEDFYQDDIHAYEDPLCLALIGRITEFIALDKHEEHVVAEMWELYRNYVSQLQTICADHTLSYERGAMLTEEEAVIGTIVAKCSQPRRRKDLMSRLREQTSSLVEGVQFDLSGEEGTLPQTSMERAWVAFRLTLLEGDIFGARSFAWIAMGEMFAAIKVIENSEGYE